MRHILTNLLLAIALTGRLTFAAENNFVGTWKLNVDQSKFNPGPGPKSLTETVETMDGGIKVTATGEGPDGTPINSSFTAKYDGKDYPVTDTGTGTPAGHHPGTSFDSIALKEVDANTLAFTTKKDGKVFSKGQAKVSGDTLTVTSTGTDANGKLFNDTAIYDRQ
jgi:hypothetical protein